MATWLALGVQDNRSNVHSIYLWSTGSSAMILDLERPIRDAGPHRRAPGALPISSFLDVRWTRQPWTDQEGLPWPQHGVAQKVIWVGAVLPGSPSARFPRGVFSAEVQIRDLQGWQLPLVPRSTAFVQEHGWTGSCCNAHNSCLRQVGWFCCCQTVGHVACKLHRTWYHVRLASSFDATGK